MAFNFKESAKQVVNLKPSLSDNKNQVSTDDLIKTFPDGVTITQFDIVEIDDRKFTVLLFQESPDSFFYGGTVLTQICESWVSEFDNDCAKCSEELTAQGGVKVKLSKGVTKSKRNITKVELV